MNNVKAKPKSTIGENAAALKDIAEAIVLVDQTKDVQAAVKVKFTAAAERLLLKIK